MSKFVQVAFDETDICPRIDALDVLDFGGIGCDVDAVVRRYNTFESRSAGLGSSRVVGHPLFTVVAPCMNNYLLAPSDRGMRYVLVSGR